MEFFIEMGIDVYGIEYYISQHDGSFHPLQKRELVENLGVYVSYLDLESKQLSSKGSATGLMRQIIGIYVLQASEAGRLVRKLNKRENPNCYLQ